MVHQPSPPVCTGPRSGQPVELRDGRVRARLSWSARPVKFYEIQISTDADFRKVAITLESPAPQRVLGWTQHGRVYWRVRTKAPVSAWSKPRHIETRRNGQFICVEFEDGSIHHFHHPVMLHITEIKTSAIVEVKDED